MYHRDRRAPVPLSRYQPVPEFRAGKVASNFLFSGLLGDRVKSLLPGEARELQKGNKIKWKTHIYNLIIVLIVKSADLSRINEHLYPIIIFFQRSVPAQVQ